MNSAMRALVLTEYRQGNLSAAELAAKYNFPLNSVEKVIKPCSPKITSAVVCKKPLKSKEQMESDALISGFLENFKKKENDVAVQAQAKKERLRAIALKAWETMRYNKLHGIPPKKKLKKKLNEQSNVAKL